jgi:hypothetical protein
MLHKLIDSSEALPARRATRYNDTPTALRD